MNQISLLIFCLDLGLNDNTGLIQALNNFYLMAWKNGSTRFPIVNVVMIELNTIGYLGIMQKMVTLTGINIMISI